MSTGRENFEHAQGIERLNEIQIAELEQQLSNLNQQIEVEVHSRNEGIQALVEERTNVTDSIRRIERQIEEVQYSLDDFVSSSVWPDYIMRDPAEAYDPGAAKVHAEMMEHHTFEDVQHITRGMDQLQLLYNQQGDLQEKLKHLDDPKFEQIALQDNDQLLQTLRDQRFNVTERLEQAKSNRSRYVAIPSSAVEEIRIAEQQERKLTKQDEAVASSERKLKATQEWLDRKAQVPAGKRIELRKSIVQNMAKPRDRAAAKLNAMGSGLFEEVLKLQTPWKHEAAAHAKEMLALRAGVAMKPRNRVLRVEVIDRGDPKGNACTCYLLDYDVIAVITIEEDRKQHDKLVYSTCLVEDDLWTEAENNTEGVPPNLSQLVHKRPADLALYVSYHHMIRNNIDESRAADD